MTWHMVHFSEIEALRPRSRPLNEFQFGQQTVRTKVHMMVPRSGVTEVVDVTASMHGAKPRRTVHLDLMTAGLFDGAKEQQP